jgi:exodeoxyribonuclease VII large subunit
MENALDGAMKLCLQHKQQDLLRFKKSTERVRPENRIHARKLELMQLEKALQLAIKRTLQHKLRETSLKANRLDLRIKELILLKTRRFSSFKFAQELPRLVQKALFLKKRNVENVKAQLEALDPKRILAKGYTILFREKDGGVITKASECLVGDEVKIAFVDGEAKAKVTTIRVNHDQPES